jgi:esterase/lipase superfamily enzyme
MRVSSPAPFHVIDGKITEDRAVIAAKQAASEQYQNELDRRLELSDTGDVIVFIRGFNTTFEKAALVHAEVWHSLGRRGVPIVYSWPAATHGIWGYVADQIWPTRGENLAMTGFPLTVRRRCPTGVGRASR